jgi:hypothetical protein
VRQLPQWLYAAFNWQQTVPLGQHQGSRPLSEAVRNLLLGQICRRFSFQPEKRLEHFPTLALQDTSSGEF